MARFCYLDLMIRPLKSSKFMIRNFSSLLMPMLIISGHVNFLPILDLSYRALMIVLWNFGTLLRGLSLKALTIMNNINSVKFHPDGTCIASGSSDNSIKIWDIRSLRLLQHYDAHQDSVSQVAFHPNGRFLLSASQDSTRKIWDLRQGHILYTLYGHEGASSAVNFSPCGD
jgi:WD40 repeat protein